MSEYYSALQKRFTSKEATVAIIGMGYVGLPLALGYAKAGFKTIGVDIDKSKVERINQGISYISHISSEDIRQASTHYQLHATTEFQEVANADAIIICVPTPLSTHKEPDLSYITSTLDSIKGYLRQGQLISLESTTYPGTTKEIVLPVLEKKNFQVGHDFFLVYSPEREDPGNKDFTTVKIPKILGGITAECTQLGGAMYEGVFNKVVYVSDTKVAEMTKLVENIHRAVNIGLMNELKLLAHKMDINLYDVIRAAATKPFGFVPYYPGPGLGGHCIPIDPFYLTWKAREYGMHTRFIELAGEINTAMPSYVVQRTVEALSDVACIALKHSKILILGLAYKKNIDDMRESPSVDLINILSSRGATVSYCDPFIKEFPRIRKLQLEMSSISLTPEALQQFDAVILATDHDIFDYEMIHQYSKILIDTRGRFCSSSRVISA